MSRDGRRLTLQCVTQFSRKYHLWLKDSQKLNLDSVNNFKQIIGQINDNYRLDASTSLCIYC